MAVDTTKNGVSAAARGFTFDAAARARFGAILEAAAGARLPERIGVCEEAEHDQIPPRV